MGIGSVPTGVFLVMLAFAGAIIGIGVFVAGRTYWYMKALQTARQIYPGDAQPGYFRVDGKAVADGRAELVAPLTQSPCLWYKIRVEKYEYRSSSGSNKSGSSSWRTIRSEESEAGFRVEWEGKSVPVNPHGAEIVPTDKSEWKGGSAEPEDRNPQRFLPSENVHGSGIQFEVSGLGGSKYRYFEERIYDGDPVFVLGEISKSGNGKFAIGKPSARLPFLIATIEPGKHAELQRKGIIGAGFIAGFGLVLMIWLMWMRWG